MGDFLRDALPGHVHREALSGPPSVRCPGRSHTAVVRRVLLVLLNRAHNNRSTTAYRHSEFRRCLHRRPAGSRGGNPHRDMGRRPGRRPVGGLASGRLPFAPRRKRSRSAQEAHPRGVVEKLAREAPGEPSPPYMRQPCPGGSILRTGLSHVRRRGLPGSFTSELLEHASWVRFLRAS